jgi:type IV fimbrial biogenesis protein FimT
MNRRNQSGLTLIELVITLAIVGVVAAAGAPALGTFIKGNRIKNKTFEILGAVNFARSEAVNRRQTVQICRTKTPNNATPVCGDNDNARDYVQGYIVFADADNDQVYDPPPGGQDVMLRRGQPSTDGITLWGNGSFNARLTYRPDGATNENGATASMAICDDRGNPFGTVIQVAPHGRARLVHGSAATINCLNPG